jgi:hypothetical protein
MSMLFVLFITDFKIFLFLWAEPTQSTSEYASTVTGTCCLILLHHIECTVCHVPCTYIQYGPLLYCTVLEYCMYYWTPLLLLTWFPGTWHFHNYEVMPCKSVETVSSFELQIVQNSRPLNFLQGNSCPRGSHKAGKKKKNDGYQLLLYYSMCHAWWNDETIVFMTTPAFMFVPPLSILCKSSDGLACRFRFRFSTVRNFL